MTPARQSTARTFAIGPVLDADGLFVTDADADDFEISKSGAAPAALHASSTVTYDDAGMYLYAANAGDVDTVGESVVTINKGTDAMLPLRMQVMEEAIYDAFYAASATGLLPANVTQWRGSTPADLADTDKIPASVQHVANNAITAAGINDGAFTAAKFASGAFDAVWSVGTRTLTAATNITAGIAAAVWEVATSGLTTAGSIGKLLVDNINAAISSRSSHSASDAATAVWASGTRTLTSISGLGIALATKLTKYVQLLARKDAAIATDNATELTEINADGGSGGGTFANTTDSGEAIRDRGDSAWTTGGGGGGLTGANTVTITVDDGTDPIVGAKVRLTDGVLGTGVLATDASGQVQFSVDDATWAVAITKPGYSFTPTTLVVNGDESQTYSMTAVTIAPSEPGQVTGYLTVFGVDGEVEEGAQIHIRQLQPISGTGIGYDGAVRTEESGADGVVEFTNLFPGGRYELWRGTSTNKLTFTLASNATDPTALNSIVGSP